MLNKANVTLPEDLYTYLTIVSREMVCTDYPAIFSIDSESFGLIGYKEFGECIKIYLGKIPIHSGGAYRFIINNNITSHIRGVKYVEFNNYKEFISQQYKTFFNKNVTLNMPKVALNFTQEENCPICLINDASCYTDCGHSFCIDCLSRLHKCAMCRKEISRVALCSQIKSHYYKKQQNNVHYNRFMTAIRNYRQRREAYTEPMHDEPVPIQEPVRELSADERYNMYMGDIPRFISDYGIRTQNELRWRLMHLLEETFVANEQLIEGMPFRR